MSTSTINAFCKFINSSIVTNNNTIFQLSNQIDIKCLISCKIPSMTINKYIINVLSTYIIPPDDIDGVILYTINILNNIKTKGLYLNHLTSHRIIIISLMLASKLYIDEYYSNYCWASISGYKLTDINKMEITFLKFFDFHLFFLQ